MELLKVDTLKEAGQKLDQAFTKELRTEEVPLDQAIGRVLACDVRSKISVPAFDRSTVDGYAVRAADTQGAGESIPCFLTVTDEIEIGHAAARSIGPGECAYVPTGGMLPAGADAMVMVEYVEFFDQTQVAVYAAVSPGQNVIHTGEDVRQGMTALRRGSRLGAPQVSVLAAIGTEKVPVFARPRLSIISTGDELVRAGEPLQPGQIYDINTWGIDGLCRENNIEVVRRIILPDEEPMLRAAITEAMQDSDIICISGGSSQGKKDFTASIIDELARPGVFTHGLALKPGKPTILGVDEASGTLLAGLPGHPAAAMVVFDLLIVDLLRRRMGTGRPRPLRAQMEVNLAGGGGRALCQMVQLIDQEDGSYLARPVLGKSGLITTLAIADGYIMIDDTSEGLKKGETVEVTPLQAMQTATL